MLYYLLVMNGLSLYLMGLDKKRARSGGWRIKESTLLMIAILGGSLGAFIAMRLYRHKTKHTRFRVGIPILLLSHLIILIYSLSNIRI